MTWVELPFLRAAHDIAHHAASALSYLSPHLAPVLRAANQQTMQMDLLDPAPYPALVAEQAPLRLALAALHATAIRILQAHGLKAADLSSMVFHVTPAPLDQQGSCLHPCMVIVARNGRVFDSGWLSWPMRSVEDLGERSVQTVKWTVW